MHCSFTNIVFISIHSSTRRVTQRLARAVVEDAIVAVSVSAIVVTDMAVSVETVVDEDTTVIVGTVIAVALVHPAVVVVPRARIAVTSVVPTVETVLTGTANESASLSASAIVRDCMLAVEAVALVAGALLFVVDVLAQEAGIESDRNKVIDV